MELNYTLNTYNDKIKKNNWEFYIWIMLYQIDLTPYDDIVKYVNEELDCYKCLNCCKKLKLRVPFNIITLAFDKLGYDGFDVYNAFTFGKDSKIFLRKPCHFLKENKCIIDFKPSKCSNYSNFYINDNDIYYLYCQYFNCLIASNIIDILKKQLNFDAFPKAAQVEGITHQMYYYCIYFDDGSVITIEKTNKQNPYPFWL